MNNEKQLSPERQGICADCAGFDLEWMYRCQKHRTEYCRGCACPHCADEAWDDYEDAGPMDLEDQLDRLLETPK